MFEIIELFEFDFSLQDLVLFLKYFLPVAFIVFFSSWFYTRKKRISFTEEDNEPTTEKIILKKILYNPLRKLKYLYFDSFYKEVVSILTFLIMMITFFIYFFNKDFVSLVFLFFEVAFIIIVFLCYMYEQEKKEKLYKLFPTMLEVMERGVKAGASIDKVFNTVAKEIDPPLKTEFKIICTEIDKGVPFEQVLSESAKRVNIKEFGFLIAGLKIQNKTGGELSMLLEGLIFALKKRIEIQMKIKAASAEAKVSIFIIASIPWIVGAIAYLTRPEFVEVFFTNPVARNMGIIAIALNIVGMFIMFRLSKFEGY